MKKIIKLTESDLAKIVKRVIDEGKESETKIHIPRKYTGIRMKLGNNVDAKDIIDLYNEFGRYREGVPLVSYSEYGTEGFFYDEDDYEISIEFVLDELNNAIVDDDDY